MSRGRKGPRQPGGGRQTAGPRKWARGERHATRHRPGARTAKTAGFEGRRPFPVEARPRGASQGDDAKTVLPTSVQSLTVTPDENDMRVDRFFEARFPGLSFSHIQRIIRKGEVRVGGKRTQPKARLAAGQSVRVPPLKLEAPKPRDETPAAQRDRAFLEFDHALRRR